MPRIMENYLPKFMEKYLPVTHLLVKQYLRRLKEMLRGLES